MAIKPASQSLISAEDSVLVVIDIQKAFLKKMPPSEAEQLVARACWLIAVAQWKKIPLVVTAEELQTQPLAEKLLAALPAGTRIYDKNSFSLASQPNILGAVRRTARKTAVLIGLETDVCVAQSALGLLPHNMRVAVVADVTGTTPGGQEIGLNRMRAAGVAVVSAKSLFYEWLRTVEQVDRFHKENPGMRDVGGIEL
jgi:nicotinamidase-related amidase